MFTLPIFPLSVVLFPGMPLPLHVFEPRYRLMISRCLENDRVFGVAQIIEGHESQEGTFPASVGCAAEIVEMTPFADGRMNIQTMGTRRFTIRALHEENGYLVGECEWLEDESFGDDTVRAALLVRRTLSRYFDSLALHAQLPAQIGDIDVPQDPYALSMFIAAILGVSNSQKQALLEMTSTKTRLELEAFLLDRAEIVQRAYAKRSASGDAVPATDESMGGFSEFVSLN